MKTRAEIQADMFQLLQEMLEDMDYEGELTEMTTFLDDLGFESLDVVIMANTLQERYGQTFPFAEYFAEIGERESRDVTVGEWIDFLYEHLSKATS
jgi:acyl carrier protein